MYFLCRIIFITEESFFQVLPVVVFFSSFIYMVYYLGIMQAVISKIAWLMQFTMGTSAAESLNTAGNIFIGQVWLLFYEGMPFVSFGRKIHACAYFWVLVLFHA